VSHSTKYLEMLLPPLKRGGSQVTPSSERETTNKFTFVGPDGLDTLGWIFCGTVFALSPFHCQKADAAPGIRSNTEANVVPFMTSRKGTERWLLYQCWLPVFSVQLSLIFVKSSLVALRFI